MASSQCRRQPHRRGSNRGRSIVSAQALKQFAGRGLRYVFTWRGRWMGAAGGQTGAFRCAPRDRGMGGRREEPLERLHRIGNPTRLVILGGAGCFGVLPRVRGRGCSGVSATTGRLRTALRCGWRSRLFHRRSSAAPCTKRRTGRAWAGARAMRAPTGALPIRTGRRRIGTGFRCVATPVVGCGIVRRFLRRGRCGRRRAAGRRGRCARCTRMGATRSDVRRAQGRTHGIASVRCVRVRARRANRHGAVAAARSAKTMTQQDLAPIGAWKNPDTGR